MRPFWDDIFAFLTAIGMPPPLSRREAIIFNLWKPDTLGPVEARATIRHAFSEMAKSFAQLDLDKHHVFCPLQLAHNSLENLRQAVVRRALKVQKMHANRIFAQAKEEDPSPFIPLEAAAKYPALISMAPDGAYQLTTLFLNEISKRKNALHAKREADKAAAAAKREAKQNAQCAAVARKRRMNHSHTGRAKSRKPNPDPTRLRGGVGAQT